MSNRVCSKCSKEQDLESCFYKTAREQFKVHGGFTLVCKTCIKEYANAGRQKNANKRRYAGYKTHKRIEIKIGDEYKIYDFKTKTVITRIYNGR